MKVSITLSDVCACVKVSIVLPRHRHIPNSFSGYCQRCTGGNHQPENTYFRPVAIASAALAETTNLGNTYSCLSVRPSVSLSLSLCRYSLVMRVRRFPPSPPKEKLSFLPPPTKRETLILTSTHQKINSHSYLHLLAVASGDSVDWVTLKARRHMPDIKGWDT